ncbi:PQQ-binding-like beta-propeller repeat protein [Amycolatopsis taiwanensis]|nr:PQQ-binding-like beta-propeller repeat protein [Amycolatopsis taiwanensis]
MPPKRSKTPMIVTILVLVVVLVGTGVTLAVTGVFSSGKSASGGTGGSGSGGDAKKLWSAPAVNADPNKPSGGWVVDDHTLANVVESGVTGYDLNTGKQLWQVPAPAGQVICAMSPRADGGIGAVGLGLDSDHCDTAAAVDLTAGKLLWQEKLTLPSNFEGYKRVLGVLWVAKEMVIVQDPETTFGYGARDGKRKWTAPPVPEEVEEWDDHFCYSMSALAEGDVTAQVLSCDSDGVKVATYDTVSGAVKGIAPASNDSAPGSWWLLSANPLVAVDARTGIYSLSGPNGSPVPIGRIATTFGEFISPNYAYGSAAFDGTTMFTVDSDEGATPSEHVTITVNSWDTTTGQSRWKHTFDVDAEAKMVGMSQGKVWVEYAAPDSDEERQLMAFSPADGSMIQGPTFEPPYDSSSPLTTQLVGNKIVRFGPPKAPVTVWDMG